MRYSIQEVKDEMEKGLCAYMLKNSDGEYRLKSVNRIPFYLEGAPGIGKTEIVRQVADELGIGFVSFSITHHTRNSLLGLPVISNLECGKYTEYTMSEIIAAVIEKEEQGEKEGVLLLDEFNCASETIMPTMLAFLQTRNIGKYRLPEGWSVVLCGNPSSFNKSARRFDAAILDRVRKMSVDYDVKDFLDYAQEQEFHSSIIEYLKINRFNLYRCGMDRDDEEVVTCRGWENLSHAIKTYEYLEMDISEKLITQYIKSVEVAHSFYSFYTLFQGRMEKEQLEEILAGKNQKKYAAIVNEEDFEFRWKLTEQLLNMIRVDGTENDDEKSKETWNAQSQKISYAIRFLKQLKDTNSLQERFLKELNQDKQLVEILTEIENKEYLELCRKSYGEFEIIEKYA